MRLISVYYDAVHRRALRSSRLVCKRSAGQGAANHVSMCHRGRKRARGCVATVAKQILHLLHLDSERCPIREGDVSHHSHAKGDKRTCTKRLILGSSAYHASLQQGEKRFVGYLQDDEGFQDTDNDDVFIQAIVQGRI
jgi:hypothetical protein